jgi:hypothetical protein
MEGHTPSANWDDFLQGQVESFESDAEPDGRWNQLPVDVITCIYSHLPPVDVYRICSRVSNAWREAAKEYIPTSAISFKELSALHAGQMHDSFPHIRAVKYVGRRGRGGGQGRLVSLFDTTT